MSDKATLKAFFETGDIPTEAQFADLIDSNVNTDETSGQSIESDVEVKGDLTGDTDKSGSSTDLAYIQKGYVDTADQAIDARLDNLEENQVTGVETYTTFANLPGTGVLLVSYKVTNDPDLSLNGFYHWTGSAYDKDDVILTTTETIATEAVKIEKTDFIETGNNLFNEDTITLDALINFATGEEVLSVNWWHSDYIPVIESTVYSAINNIRNLAYYNEQKVYISGESAPTNQVTTPSNAFYIRYSQNTIITNPPSASMFNEGSALPYEQHYIALKNQGGIGTDALVFGAVTNDKIGFDEININKAEFAILGNNLFNRNTVVLDTHIDALNGEEVSLADWWCSDFITVDENTQYRTFEARNYAFYDDQKIYISGSVAGVNDITTPADTRFFRFSRFNVSFEETMFNEGADILAFEEYIYRFLYDANFLDSAAVLQLPEFIDALNGELLQIYYSSMIAFPNWERFYFAADLSGGNDFKRYVEFDPTSTGDFVLSVRMYDENHTIKSSASTTIRVRNSVQQPASTVNYWNVGDSLTLATEYTGEMLRRLTGTGGTPAGDGFGNIVNHIEGNTGKDWDWYVNDEASPFVFSGVLDFEQYRIDNVLAVPEVLYILLTWNGMGTDRNQSEWDLWDDDVYTFIDALRADFPSVEVKLMSPQFPSQNGGLGTTAGLGADFDSYSNIFLSNRNAIKQAEIYERISGEASYSAWVEHINTALVLDSKYNMPSALKDVNTRNSSVQEEIGNDNVHPSNEGDNQIADAGYRNFILNYCQ